MSMYDRWPSDSVLGRHIEKLKERGGFVCDAVNHNEPSGCDNPECFNWRPGPQPRQGADGPSDTFGDLATPPRLYPPTAQEARPAPDRCRASQTWRKI